MSGRYEDCIIAGFGGQGVLLIGNLLAYAGMEEGLNVTFIPVYGAEMRGGTANCTVVVSEEEIGSPIIRSPRGLIALNRPSLEKFQPRLRDGGTLVVNTSLIDAGLMDTERVRCVPTPVNDIAERLGNPRLVNMVAIGAYVHATGAVALDTVKHALTKVVSSHNAHLIPANEAAIQAGADHAAEVLASA